MEEACRQAGAVCLLSEFSFRNLRTGTQRRVEHYLEHFRSVGIDVRSIALNDGDVARFSVSYARAARARDFTPDNVPVISIGLGSAIALRAAIDLDRAGRRVWVDQCDSALIQLWQAMFPSGPKVFLFALVRVALRLRLPRKVGVIYISERDLNIDRIFNAGKPIMIVPPTVSSAFSDLEADVPGLKRRLVVPGDFTSPHVAKGLRMLRRASRLLGDEKFIVDAYGPADLPSGLGFSSRYHGFVEDVVDIYRGNSVIFIANVGGAGVPNKVLEAAAAGRPVIVHRRLMSRSETAGRGWSYHSARSLAGALRSAINGEEAPEIGRRDVAPLV